MRVLIKSVQFDRLSFGYDDTMVPYSTTIISATLLAAKCYKGLGTCELIEIVLTLKNSSILLGR